MYDESTPLTKVLDKREAKKFKDFRDEVSPEDFTQEEQ